jgi:hypothetical protein
MSEALAEHETKLAELMARAADASRSPEPAEMLYVRFAGQLARLQGELAKRLGLAATDAALGARFAGEDAKLKELFGL